MKKILALLLAVLMLFALSACGVLFGGILALLGLY